MAGTTTPKRWQAEPARRPAPLARPRLPRHAPRRRLQPVPRRLFCRSEGPRPRTGGWERSDGSGGSSGLGLGSVSWIFILGSFFGFVGESQRRDGARAVFSGLSCPCSRCRPGQVILEMAPILSRLPIPPGGRPTLRFLIARPDVWTGKCPLLGSGPMVLACASNCGRMFTKDIPPFSFTRCAGCSGLEFGMRSFLFFVCVFVSIRVPTRDRKGCAGAAEVPLDPVTRASGGEAGLVPGATADAAAARGPGASRSEVPTTDADFVHQSAKRWYRSQA
jgi:hypothetical protein